MKARFKLSAWVAVVALAGALAGCGSSGVGPAETSLADSATVETRADPTVETSAELTGATAESLVETTGVTALETEAPNAQTTTQTAVATETVAPNTTAPVVEQRRVEAATVDGRAFEVNIPATYDASRPVPLVVALHGYTGSGAGAKEFFRLERQASERGFLTVYPEGTKDANGSSFWNATDACCKLSSTDADDAAFLAALIDHVETNYSVDRKRVYFVGHSNGGFMSYRMACEHADRIAAIVSVAGATFDDVTKCAPSEPVGVVQVHGTSDTVIAFTGGSIFANDYPAAQTTAATWATYNGCTTTSSGTNVNSLDLDGAIDGDDAKVRAFTGCKPGAAVELWTIEGGLHSPQLTDEFASSVVDFFLAHPKP